MHKLLGGEKTANAAWSRNWRTLAKSKEKGQAVCVGLRRQPLEGYHMGKCWTWRPAKAPDGLGTWLAGRWMSLHLCGHPLAHIEVDHTREIHTRGVKSHEQDHLFWAKASQAKDLTTSPCFAALNPSLPAAPRLQGTSQGLLRILALYLTQPISESPVPPKKKKKVMDEKKQRHSRD